MAKTNDIQSVPVNSDVVTHQPPPYYDQTKIRTEQVFHQNPQGPTYIQPNGQIVAVAIAPNGTYGYYADRRPTSGVDYLNLVWSVINTCCCLWPMGLVALIVSIVTLRMRHRGNDDGAKIGGISAVVLNILGTVGGILLFIFYFLPLIRNHGEY